MDASATHMQQPVRDYATKEFLQLRETMRVDEALQPIRHHRSTTQTLIYFYVVDGASRLSGVLQTGALVAAEPKERLSEIMIQRVVAIPDTATVLDACEFFVLHKFLAFPIIANSLLTPPGADDPHPDALGPKLLIQRLGKTDLGKLSTSGVSAEILVRVGQELAKEQPASVSPATGKIAKIESNALLLYPENSEKLTEYKTSFSTVFIDDAGKKISPEKAAETIPGKKTAIIAAKEGSDWVAKSVIAQ